MTQTNKYQLPEYLQYGRPVNPQQSTYTDSTYNDMSAYGKTQDGLLKPVNKWATGLNALSSGVNAYTGYKTLQLGQDQFDRSKLEYNRDLANQTQVYNTQMEAGAKRGLGNSGKFAGAADGEYEAALAAYTKANSVNGKAL